MISENPFSLSGKHLLITGASSGIGKATAILCAKMGATLTITGRNTDRLHDVLESLEGTHHKMIVADLNDLQESKLLAEEVDTLDGVCFCAGIHESCLIKNLTNVITHRTFESNILSTIELCTNLLKERKITKGCSIVFISSIATRVAETGNTIYSASKGAVLSFARAMAKELCARKVRVNTISPGMVRTPMTGTFGLSEEELQEDELRYPLGYGMPSDIANAVVYLLSDASRWVTGADICLDGGLTLH